MATKKFFGAWTSPSMVRRLRALAQLHGCSQSELLRRLVADATDRALAASQEFPGESSPAAEMQNRTVVRQDQGAVLA